MTYDNFLISKLMDHITNLYPETCGFFMAASGRGDVVLTHFKGHLAEQIDKTQMLSQLQCQWRYSALKDFRRHLTSLSSVVEMSIRSVSDISVLMSHVSWASCQIRKIAGAHAPGMPGTFSPSPRVSDPDMHHGTCVTHVPWCMSESLTNGFLWNRRRGKMFPAFPAHAQPAVLRIW